MKAIGFELNRTLRMIGLYLFNCVIAVYGTALILSQFRFNRHEVEAFIHKTDLAECITAFALGYFIYRRWRWAPAKWVWLAGLCWFGQRVLRFWLNEHGPLGVIHGSHSIYWEMSGGGLTTAGAPSIGLSTPSHS